MSKRNSMTTLTRWVLRHKKLVVGMWMVITLVGFAAMGPAGKSFNDTFSVPGKEAFTANTEIVRAYGNGGDSAPLVPVVSLPAGTTVDSPGCAPIAARDERSRALPGARIASYASHDRTFVSGTAARPSRSSTSPRRAPSPGRPRPAGPRPRSPACASAAPRCG